jgi:hypothetical protein
MPNWNRRVGADCQASPWTALLFGKSAYRQDDVSVLSFFVVALYWLQIRVCDMIHTLMLRMWHFSEAMGPRFFSVNRLYAEGEDRWWN